MKLEKLKFKHLTATDAYRQESTINAGKAQDGHIAICNFRRSVVLFISIFLLCSFNVFSQDYLNTIKAWEGWKLGNVIKVSGSVKFGNEVTKAGGYTRYLIVNKIDGKPIDSSRTIQISYDEDLFSTLKNNDTITFLGYVSGSYCGIPDFNDYKIEYWQDEQFHFEFYFVFLKDDD